MQKKEAEKNTTLTMTNFMQSPVKLMTEDPILGTADSDMIMQLLVWKNPEAAAFLITSLIDWGMKEELITVDEDKLRYTEFPEDNG